MTVRLPIVRGVSARVPEGAVARLQRAASVIAVTPNERVTVQGTSGGGGGSGQARSVFFAETNAHKLWLEGHFGSGVRVALIDTGVTPHADLAGRLVKVPDPRDPDLMADCVNMSGESGCGDSYGHGTFLAGLIAGSGATSGYRFPGMAPGAQIVSVKIAGRDGSADVTKVLAAIQWVVSFKDMLNIKVLNLSLGTNSTVHYRFDPLNFAVQRAWDSGIAVVVSASNRGPDAGTISKPADDPLVISVGAVDDRQTYAVSDDTLPRFSARGPTAHGLAKPDLAAPGGRVISLRSPGSLVEQQVPGGGIDQTYRRGSGTSMSAAIVSGAIALFLSADPAATPDRIKFALMETARKPALDDPSVVGRGVIDVHSAVRAAPPGLANQGVITRSDASGTLDGSRADVLVSRQCRPFEELIDPDCDHVHGERTAQDRMWDSAEYSSAEWTGSSWYQSQWAMQLGSSWYGSSWYGSSWYGSSWYGSDGGDGSSQYDFGTAILGSSWYGAWG